MGRDSPAAPVVAVVLVLSVLASAFTWPLQQRTDAWAANLAENGHGAAGTIVRLIPYLLWILLAVAMVLAVIGAFFPEHQGGV